MKRRPEARTPTPAHPVMVEPKQSPDSDGSREIEGMENVDMTNFSGKLPIKNLKRCVATPPGVKSEVAVEKEVKVNSAPSAENSYIGRIRLVGNFQVSPNSAFEPFVPEKEMEEFQAL